MTAARKDPVVTFAFYATSVALKAMAGQLTLRDRLGLAERALLFAIGRDDLRDEVLTFLSGVYDATNTDCGKRFLDFLGPWLERETGIPAVADPSAFEVADDWPTYGWQARKDAGFD